MVVLISVVYYSGVARERERAGGGREGGGAAVMRTTEGARGREDRRRRRGRRWSAGGGCLPPLNPLVLALNMIQMLSSLLFPFSCFPPDGDGGGTRTTSDHPDPPGSLRPLLRGLVLRFRSTATHPPSPLSHSLSLALRYFLRRPLPSFNPGIARG